MAVGGAGGARRRRSQWRRTPASVVGLSYGSCLGRAAAACARWRGQGRQQKAQRLWGSCLTAGQLLWEALLPLLMKVVVVLVQHLL